MNKIIFLIIASLILGTQVALSKEVAFVKEQEEVFLMAISVISSFKYNLEEINYSRGKAIFTTQTDSYLLEIMQNNKNSVIKIEEINASTDATKATIDNILAQLIKIYGQQQ